MPPSSPGGGGWAQVELTDALAIAEYWPSARRKLLLEPMRAGGLGNNVTSRVC